MSGGAAGARSPAPPRPADYALVVGIGEYGFCNVPSLDGANQDTDDVLDWLREHEGIPEANTVVLRGRPCDATCAAADGYCPAHRGTHRPLTRDTVQELIEARLLRPLAERVRGMAAADRRLGRIVLYFAGHGVWNTDQPSDAMLLASRAADAPADGIDATEFLHLTQLANLFIELAWFDEVVLVVDSCREDYKYDSSYTTGNLPDTWWSRNKGLRRWIKQTVSSVMVFAAEPGCSVPEKWLGGRRRGVFTYFFRESLTRAARTAAGVEPAALEDALRTGLEAYYQGSGAKLVLPMFFPAGKSPPAFRVAAAAPPEHVSVFFRVARQLPGAADRINFQDAARAWAVYARPAGGAWAAAVKVMAQNAASAGPFPANLDVPYEYQLGWMPPPPDGAELPLTPPAGWVQVRAGSFCIRDYRTRVVADASYVFGAGGSPAPPDSPNDGVPGTPHQWRVAHVDI